MPHLDFSVPGPFAQQRKAGRAAIELSLAPAAERLQQSANVAGVRTSGVGQLGRVRLLRQRALALSGLEERLRGAEVAQVGAERLTTLQARLQAERDRRLAALGDLAGKTAARRAFQGQLTREGIRFGRNVLLPAVGRRLAA